MKKIKHMEEFKVFNGSEVKTDTGETIIAEYDIYRNEHGKLVRIGTQWKNAIQKSRLARKV
jgi:molybdenum-dependent DNA-binding transcriptional regulator ModE